MTFPELIAFDLDQTLATSKAAITPEMATLLEKLLSHTKVAVISGGKFEQFKLQIVEHLPQGTPLNNLYLLPTSGAALYEHKEDGWQKVYEELLSDDEVDAITDALRSGATQSGLVDFSKSAHGAYIENRGAQVSLSVLGQEAPVEEKRAWDPSGEKREQLRTAIAPLLPDFDVKKGGMTTIDVTKHGINKAFGIRKLSAHLHISIDQMLYIGDALHEGGNDAVVKETGIRTHAVESPEDTAHLISGLLSSV